MPGQFYRVTGGLADGWWAAASATHFPSKTWTALYLDVVSADSGMVGLLKVEDNLDGLYRKWPLVM